MNELVRWDPFRTVAPFDNGFFAIPSLFRPLAGAAGSAPRMDVVERDGAYELSVELPGVKKEAIQVNVYDNSVTISAELPTATQDGEDMQWLLRERSAGTFSRTIALPEALDDESAQARYADGVLYLTLKKKSASQAKRITIH
jgi:HSP20 family protein